LRGIARGIFDMKIFNKVLWGLAIFNIVSVILSLLPPGRAYYMPEFLAEFTMLFVVYVISGLGISGIIGTIGALGLMIYEKVNGYDIEKNQICLLVMFILTIPLGWFLFNAFMSV